MIEKLRKINEGLLILNKNNEQKEKYELIKKILKDDKCFFKMDMETSYALLRDLEIKEKDLEKIYKELIDDKYFS